jgi:hypothetical protein
MPFSSSFCLTNIGSLQLGTSVDFYSDEDNYTDPFQTDILLSEITGTNCPYVLNGIPDGTTTLQILDVNSSCCVEIPISTFTCDDCNFGFDVYSSVTFNSRIVAGNLTASCDNNITDYIIEWYNVNDLTTPLYVSGLGDEFVQYQNWTFPHPLTGNTSIPVTSGTYIPVIKYIRLNGINYSSDLENGLVQIPLENCLSTTTIDVNPLTCDNGTNIGDYTHLIQFSGSSQGQPPSLLSSTFILSPNTNYFAWRFNAFNVQDTVKITYYGSYYNNTPIILEYFNVGIDNTYTDYSDNINPKFVRIWPGTDQGFNKVTCLTGLTRSFNDYLILEITPNQSNPKTDFQLYLTCLENYDCTSCNDNFLNQPYKIVGSTISGVTQSCDRLLAQFIISGCSLSDLENSDYYKYTFTPGIFVSPFYGNTITYVQTTSVNIGFQLYYDSSFCGGSNSTEQTFCVPPSNNNLITFTKDNSGVGGIGNVLMTFSNIDDLQDFYNTYNTRLNEVGGVQTDPGTLNYYSWIGLKVPVLSLDPVTAFNETCGDTSTFTDYYFHNSSVVTTGVTGNGWYMNLTMPTITKQINYNVCQLYCDYSVEDIVYSINNKSTGTTNNVSWINNWKNRVNIPFYSKNQIFYFENSQLAGEGGQYYNTLSFLNKTIPMSGSNYTLIPELSASTCNLLGEYINNNNPSKNLDKYDRYVFQFYVELTNPNDINDFKISTKNISNGVRTGNYFRIWEIQNGTVIYSDPNFII